MQFRVRPSSKKSNNNDISSIEFPTIKSFNQGQASIPRSITSKIDHLQSSLAMFQQLYRKQREAQNSNSLDVQKRLDRVQYKIFTAEQDIRQFNQIREIKAPRETYTNSPESQTSKNQIIVLKQVILQEREAQKENLKHQNSLIQQLTLKQMRAEQEFREMITQQRMDYQSRLSGQGDEMRQIQGLKQRKIQQQYELMKGVIANAQRKIYEQLQRKIQNQMIIKDYIEGKLIDLKEEISNDHKETIVAESKFIKQTKNSLENLFALINNVRKQLSEELNETQKLSVKSIQKLSNTMDIIRHKSNDELKQINMSHQEISNELVQIRNFFTTKLEQNRQFMSQFQEQTLQKLEHSDLHDKGPNSNSIDSERFSLFQKEMNQWKSITQQKNLNVFKQISNTLKTMKLQWRKQNDELVSQVAALDESLRALKKTGPAELKKNIQAIVTIFNNQFDVLADELQSLTQMIALAKKENQKFVKEEGSKTRNDIIEQAKIIINQKGKQGNLYTDKAITKNEESMKVFISKQIKYGNDIMGKRLDKIELQATQLQSAMKKANILTATQLQDYSIKLKNFNDSYKQYLQQLRKEDLKKRMDLEESMRKNASNLMDICYKKCEFLVDGLKKSIETSQMKQRIQYTQIVQNAKDELKKEVQGARLEWQKELSTGMQKLTKQRENSQQILHEAIEQSLITTKTNLVNQLNNAKIQLQQKLNDFKVNEVQKEAKKEAQSGKDQADLKTSIQKALQQQQKLIIQNKNAIQNMIQQQNKLAAQNKANLQKMMQQQQKNTAESKPAIQKMLEQQQKNTSESITATKKQFQGKLLQLEKANAKSNEETQKRIKIMIEDVKKNTQAEINASHEAEKNKEIQSKNKAEVDKKIQELSKQIDLNNKKIEDLNKKLGDMLKSTSQKQASAETENKKVGEKSLNQLREQLEQQIKQLQLRMEELASKNDNEEQDEAINNMRKSINKMEAMVFSEQAKNKALFDRMTEDINKMSQNISMIANEMRD